MGVGRAAAAAAGVLVGLTVPSLSHGAISPNRGDHCVHAGRDTCGTTSVGFYAVSRYGLRWYGDYRRAVPKHDHLFCIDLRFWYASPAYRYRRAPTTTLRNRAGVRVPATRRHRMAYALSRFGQSTRPAQQAAVMLYVHSLMDDARPGELDPTAAGQPVAVLLPRIARAAARYAGPYHVALDVSRRLVVGTPASATLRIVSAAGVALPGVPLSVSLPGASEVSPTTHTDAKGVARVAFVPTAASGLVFRVSTGPLPSTEPTMFAPTASTARANGQRLVAASSQHVSRTLTRSVVAAPQLSASATPSSPAVGSSVRDTFAVHGLGGANAAVRVELWGPFRGSSEVACTGTPRWSASFETAGDTTMSTVPVVLEHGGYYAYRVSIPAAPGVVGVTTVCGASSQTAFAVARPTLATTVSAAVVRPRASVSDRIVVRGLGRTPATLIAELYGPFGSRAAIRCDASHLVWRGSMAVSGDGTVRTRPRRLERAGFYGFREQIAATPAVAATTAPCASERETALAAPEIVTGKGDVHTNAAPIAQGRRSRPVRVRIASLGVDAPVVSSGIDVAHGVLGVPADIHRLGWWRDGAAPGDATGTTLIAGHLDSASGGTGALFALRDARAGNTVEVDTASGRRFEYRIVSVHLYAKAALPPSVFTPNGAPRLVLVTCGGPFDDASGHYLDDLVVTAVPARDS
jgi:Sortase domain